METTASLTAHARSVFDVIRSAWRRYSGDGFRAKAASLGLFTVLVGASAFGMWSAVSTWRSAERAITSNILSDHYEDAATAVAAEESLERKYRLEPGHEVRLRFEKASADVGAAMELVRRDGNSEDRTVADQVTLAYGPYLRAIDRMFDAVDRGETRLVLQIDGDEVDPRFDRIEEVVNRAEHSHHATALADLARLKAQENFNARATPVVFLGGLMLVALFASVLRRTRAQLDDQRVKAVHDALHDALTGLPNRTLMSDRFEQALRAGKRASSTTALLLIDLDRFKEVNDTLGHQVGDQLLAQIGPRLIGALRDSDTVARLGGDEFAVLLPEVDGLTGALDVAARLRATLADSFTVDGVELDVDASIGVVISGAHGENAIELLQHADVAMYVAKQQKRGVVVYNPANDGHSPERLSLLSDLRHGIERGELFLHYQPKISLRTGEMTGVEALVRWQHPEHGLIPPNDFIPLAEHTGLIGPLTIWVLNTALAQVKVWADGGRAVSVAVNVSARNLVDDDFAKKVAAALAQHGVPANLLEVEVTESAVMLEPDRATRILNQLHALGVRIALDDFGIGYTSLAQLKTLPISELKIDKSFILAMHSNRDDAMIVRSMVDLGHSLNMKVVAEGVETAHAASMLADYRCDTAQGYHLCRPVQAEALMHWYRERTVPPRASSSVNRSGLAATGL
jgi:diguanylate cyclase (GGDEF)-like protein